MAEKFFPRNECQVMPVDVKAEAEEEDD